MSELIGVYGASGCGRGILPLIRAETNAQSARIVFIDDAEPSKEVNGHVLLTWQQFLADPAASKSVCLAIASSAIREQLAKDCDANAIPLRGARAQNVIEMDNVVLGEGACLSPFVTLTSNIQIGRCFHANLYSYVEHDCVIGDFVTFAPGVKCNGNVHINDHAYIGAGAIIRQGQPERPMTIGKGAMIGMGAVVTKDVPPGVTVMGNPARVRAKGAQC
jgi:sugar O-acyltransferase (sialic acid O-acetyltransferase NeuD family)